MEAQAARSSHPLVIIAAVAITLFSLVGIGAVLGWIPTSVGTQSNTAPAPLAQAPVQLQPPVQPAAQPEPVKQVEQKPAPHPKPKAVVKHEAPAPIPQAAVPPPPPVHVAAICKVCAVIEEVREVEKAGQASGAGAVGGAVVGGVVGHQVGSGRGRDVATVLGALGGAFGGNAIEKNVKKTKEYQIWIRYEDGSKGMFVQPTPPGWRIGDKVKVIDGSLQSNG
jgi:outer membrane lipoprotein SlyB